MSLDFMALEYLFIWNICLSIYLEYLFTVRAPL